MSEAKNKLRALTIGKSSGYRHTAVALASGEVVHVREPSVKQHSIILTAARAVEAQKDQSKIDVSAMRVEALMQCCVVPETGERLFEETDREGLFEMGFAQFEETFGPLVEAAMAFISDKAAEAAEKN